MVVRGPDTSVLKDEQRSVSGIWIWQAGARVGWSVLARHLAWAIKKKVMIGTDKEGAGWSRAGQGGEEWEEDGLAPPFW